MQFRVFQIKPGFGYTFLIGSQSAPTNRLREQIGDVLAGVWRGLFEGESEIPDYGFDLVFDKSTPTGETELPVLKPGETYIVFVLLESESGSTVGDEETTGGITRAIENSVSRSKMKPRIGVVTLYQCSIQTLESEHYHSGVW